MQNKKIIFIPTSEKNPYQMKLAEKLAVLGNCILLSKSCNKFPILIPVLSNWKPDILHLHWTHTFIKSKNRIERLIKCARTLVEIVLIKAMGIKVVWTVHNLADHDSDNTYLEDTMDENFFNVFI